MTKEQITAAAALAAVLVGGGVAIFEAAATVDPKPDEVKTLTDAKAQGLVGATTIYAKQRPDGGNVYASEVAKSTRCSIDPKATDYDAACGKDGTVTKIVTTFVDDTPCAWRPEGVKPSTCTKVDGGDPGDENTMLEGQWVGAGCKRKACVKLAGERDQP